MSRITNDDNIMRLAHGKWRSILMSNGLSESVLDGKHHPCPICGGKDRFRFINKKGDGWWICNQCGSGDGMDMYMALTNQDFVQAVVELKKNNLGTFMYDPHKRDNTQERKSNMKYNAELWKAGVKNHPLLAEYMEWRGIEPDVWRGADLTIHPDLKYVGDDGKRGAFPAMLARISTRDSKLALIHRTYLYKNNEGAFVVTKKMTSPSRDWRGGSAKLFPTNDESRMIVAEGIETALSVRALIYRKHGILVPCWAATNANALENMAIPEHIKTVMVAADNDESFTGQKAAYTLANRLVVMDKKRVKVVVPKEAGTDFNDEVMNNG